MQESLETLSNGLRTIFIDQPGSGASTVQIWFNAGSALETKEEEGSAHFLEHMFFKGTKKRPGHQIANEIESFGGEINAFTSFDYTCYYANCPSTKLTDTVDILMDMVSDPLFSKEDIETEREVVIEEYRRSIDSPNQYLFNRIQSETFSGGYNHPILGTEENIRSFTREKITSFRSKHYHSDNIVVVVAGDLKKKNEITQMLSQYKIPKGKTSSFQPFSLNTDNVIEIHEKETTLCSLALISEAPEMNHPEAPIEDLVLSMLGHGESSRLYHHLVLETQLAQSASASTMFFKSGGINFVKFTYPAENHDKIIKEINQTLNKLATDGFNADELRKIKNQYVSSKIYEKETIESFAFNLGHNFIQLGDISADELFLNRMKKVTLEEVNSHLFKIISKNTHAVLQTPIGTNNLKLNDLREDIKSLFNIKKKTSKKKKDLTKIGYSQYDPQIKILEIEPGIKLLYRRNSLTPSFVLQAYLKGGISHETKKKNGLYHLLSSCLTRGYRGCTEEKMKRDLEELSTSLFSFSGKNAYGMSMHGLSEHFEKTTKHFFNSLLSPSLSNKSLNKEKKLALRSLDSQKEDPVRTCFNEFSQLIFHRHPYSLNSLGTKESIKEISSEQLSKTHATEIKSGEILITYCGDLSQDIVLNEIKHHLKKKVQRRFLRREKKFKKAASPNKYSITKSLPREQTHFIIGFQTGKMGTEESVVLRMITAHLSGQSSELFVELRDRRGLCYTAQPIHFSALECGYWAIYVGTGNEKVNESLNATRDLIEELAEEGLSKQQFDRIKTMVKGQIHLNLQTNEDFANAYSIPLFQGLGVDTYHKTNKKIEEMERKKFNQILKRCFKRKKITVVVSGNEENQKI